MMEQETELLRGQIHHLQQRVVQQEAELVDATSTSRVVQLESQLQRMTDEAKISLQRLGQKINFNIFNSWLQGIRSLIA
jgi:hypothetical protein